MRPYGVGLLVIGYDSAPHLFETCPSGNFFEFKGQAIGSRSQSSRTYIERNVDALPDATLDQLIQHGLKALRESLPTGSEPLSVENCAVGVIGKDTPFRIIEDEDMAPHVCFLNPLFSPLLFSQLLWCFTLLLLFCCFSFLCLFSQLATLNAEDEGDMRA